LDSHLAFKPSYTRNNPLDDISNIRKLRFVVTQGRMFDCAKLWETVGFKT